MPSAMLPLDAASMLRHTLQDPRGFVSAPGVYDGLSARLAISEGFETIYMTGAGTAASVQGHADLAICSLDDMRRNAEMIANLDPSIPLIADADTGYGGPIMVARTTEQYIRSGVAGFHIEDQVQTKRCGHLGGKTLVDRETFITRIRAAVQARHRLGSDIVIIARTDALQTDSYEEAVQRLRLARDAGADCGFLEGMTSREMARQAVKDLEGWPMLLNMVQHGSTPSIGVDEARNMGFKIIIFPFAALGAALIAIRQGMHQLKKDGIPDLPVEITPQHIFRSCGLEQSMKIDHAAGGQAFVKSIESNH